MRQRLLCGAWIAIAASVLPAVGCGYRVAGKSDVMPQTVHTIAITPFANRTIRYNLARELPAAITREFIERTHYKIVTDPNNADAVLDGAVLNFTSYPVIADQSSGRATVVQCSAYLRVTLTDRATKKVLFQRPTFEVRERYEISVDPQAYFDESGAGMARMSRDVARDVVTSILENF
ncbi:MAG TPA: LPS assembly lipoprotein LptE [Bryobacteraceae bacterium]|nr:LPS assembly lipoprotein LptE [Bryobacteraceae bacterium]